MSTKANSLAFDELVSDQRAEEDLYQPKLEVFVKSHNGLVKYSVDPETSDEVIKIQGRITVSF